MAMAKVHHNKLVGDKIPGKLTKKGLRFKATRVPDAKFQDELRKKLIEEAIEASKSMTREGLAEEIADILEVIDELRRSNGLSASQIAAAKRKKFSDRGGFRDRIFLKWVEKEPPLSNETIMGRGRGEPEG